MQTLLTKEAKDVHISRNFDFYEQESIDMKNWHWTPATDLTDMLYRFDRSSQNSGNLTNMQCRQGDLLIY
jgi:hypothetical protein